MATLSVADRSSLRTSVTCCLPPLTVSVVMQCAAVRLTMSRTVSRLSDDSGIDGAHEADALGDPAAPERR